MPESRAVWAANSEKSDPGIRLFQENGLNGLHPFCAGAHGELHIRLAACQPYLTHHHVFEGEMVLRRTDMKKAAFAARSQLLEPDNPLSALVSCGGPGLAGEFDMHLAAGWGAAPDRELYSSL